ncbi:aminotransferase class I/II-fold pyridoxal phosphate-dependent enzyme [Desulfuromonas sp. TF]|uniref:aminotransferase class I/II-fold pyridoxal phosphate-dependent enzyme n=1 Tax=Desulfuromonas sp. TF TaxID=1232410 RepID=UPI0004081378|nr:aminotransferase class I/II-fold pyridoxal phosphate-dependent enzyme [Desulfuromonas sp. TF]
MTRDLSKTIIKVGATIRDAMASIDLTAHGVVFVLGGNTLVGILTDGDIRRALLGGASLTDPVERYMNRDFVSGSVATGNQANLKLLNERIRTLPVIDAQGQLVEILHWADLYRLPIMEPDLQGKELEYVVDCLTSNWISSQGQYVEDFQQAFRSYLGGCHALCVSNGTVAIHLALVALGIGSGDEVIVPDLTFVAPASMILHTGAKPVLVDVDRRTWTIDPSAVEAAITSRTRAILPVHLYGHPCDMDPLLEIARKHDLYVIEDCAEALGAEYKGRKVGTFGDIGTFSFFANKVITTGEGGMVVTRNPELHHRMMLLRDHGMSRERRYWHLQAGFNYRLTNIQAAIGLAQMERIEKFLAYRDKVIKRYDMQLGGLPGIVLPPREAWGRNIFWLYSILVDETASGIDRDSLMSQLAVYGIDTRPFFHPVHQQPPYADGAAVNCPNSTWLAASGMSLPTSNNISLDDVDRVCKAVRSILDSSTVFRHHERG